MNQAVMVTQNDIIKHAAMRTCKQNTHSHGGNKHNLQSKFHTQISFVWKIQELLKPVGKLKW